MRRTCALSLCWGTRFCSKAARGGGVLMEAKEWIQTLRLKPHPEGGFFRETYRSGETISRQHLPPRFSGDRAFATAIYFLLEGHDFSALHRIQQGEVWHFYDGCSLTVTRIATDGAISVVRLGREGHAGEVLQAVVPAGCLFGAGPAIRAGIRWWAAPSRRIRFRGLRAPDPAGTARPLSAAHGPHRATDPSVRLDSWAILDGPLGPKRRP